MNGIPLRKEEKWLLYLLWGAVGGFTLILVAAAWPSYWRFIAAETTPLAWLESVLLALTAFVSGLNAYFDAVANQIKRAAREWSAVACGFAWLALDERFALHERVRDRLLKPTGFRLLPWMEAGDVLIPLYMAFGLAVAWGIWRLLRARAASRAFFVAALVLSACAVLMDTIDVRSLDKGMERLLQSVEEIVETAAMTSFLSAFLLVWTGNSLLSGDGKSSKDGEACGKPESDVV